MKGRQGLFIGLMGAMVSVGVLADLPDQSILTRYGISADQLPMAEGDHRADAPSHLPRFELQMPRSWIRVDIEAAKRPGITGNISIDRSNRQEYEHCLRMQEQSLRRTGATISCDEGGLALEMDVDQVR
ncbi:hypothetical protein SAMN03159507_04447 [Pseudomonas sp. NFACC32-1]|uniref:hypothetical protein n=1 Tax=Pseudomonas TaxID=286 RepID=UPI000876AC58|nr:MULTISPECIES: hypothetical protein [Pseudomonas]MDB6442447.1 hypothetical protein [Pseudomonas sp. 21TX0197]MDT8905720.1 hypothetical protein [Pseudomonas prosekii]ROO34851.1 hypothetical protein BIV09_21055 [Pseudomonas sp. 7SR1]ROO42320.1 hypothetical protein BIV08_10905 [Pseudomonas sp. AF76]SCX70715.1 hypothetical protein SAMN03159507_04447 [Pseudomonas sp. NFACC32-1]